jgi:hypothetical protein
MSPKESIPDAAAALSTAAMSSGVRSSSERGMVMMGTLNAKAEQKTTGFPTFDVPHLYSFA